MVTFLQVKIAAYRFSQRHRGWLHSPAGSDLAAKAGAGQVPEAAGQAVLAAALGLPPAAGAMLQRHKGILLLNALAAAGLS